VSAPTGAVPRLRSAAFALAAVGLAVGAHVTAGGMLPAVPLAVGLVALVEAAATAWARNRRGAVTTAAALVVAQALLHVVLSAAEPSHAGHAHHGSATTPGMLAAHGLAAVVLGFLLSHGDRMAGWAVGLLVPIVVVAPFRPRVGVRVLPATPAGTAAVRSAISLHDLSRRGPPRVPVAVGA
jgi:hypothetical protein